MDLGDLIWFFFIFMWLFSGLISRIVKAIRTRSRPGPRESKAAPRPGVSQTAPGETGASRQGTTRAGTAMPEGARYRPPRAVPPPVPPAPQPSTPQDPLTQLLKQLGIDLETATEKPVAAEHRRTPAEHRRTATEVRRSADEHDHTPGWHDRTASEVRRTASEAQLEPSEHRLSAGEHVGGEAWLEAFEPATREAPAASRRPGFAARLRGELSGGREALARAIVLREILGPPLGLRTADQDRR